MGQKVNPIAFRIQANKTWDSRWFAAGDAYRDAFHQDVEIKKHIKKNLKNAGVSRTVIERSANLVRVNIFTSKPGVIIGKKGSDLERLKKKFENITGKETAININEIKKPELDAQIVADGIAQQLERRVAYKRAMKRALQSSTRFGAKGIKINCAGRLNGAEIAREEWYREGRIPLHTLRADIDYATSEADTPYGVIGIKVWIYKGELPTNDPMGHEKRIKGNIK